MLKDERLAFLVTADVPEIYMQEFKATTNVHHHAIRFKMDNKKHIVNLESFRDMLHICPRVHGQSFDEPPFEEEIIAFIRFLGHSATIRTLNDNMQQFGALLPIELTNKEIRNSNAYKEYYAIATGAAPPKPKASVKRTRSSFDTSITPPTTKGKQTAKASKAKSLSALSKAAMTEAQQLKLNSTDDEGADNKGKDGDYEEDEDDDGAEGDGDDDDEDDHGEKGDDDDADQEVKRDDDKDDEEEGGNDEHEFDEEEYDEEIRDEESFDPIPKTPKNSEDEGNDEEDLGLNVSGEERHVEKEKEDELYRDVNINHGRGIKATLEVEDSDVTLTPVNPDGQQQSSPVSSQFMTSMLNLTLDVGMESIFETTSQLDVQTPTTVAPLPMAAPTMTTSTIVIITTTSQAPILPTTTPSIIIQNLPNFSSLFGFNNRLRTFEAKLSEFMQTKQFAGAISAILRIVQRYMDQWMNEAVKVAIQIQSGRLRDEAQRENDEFLKTVDENMQKIIKEQVKEQVKVQVSKILQRIEQAVNEQLKAKVLTRSSHSSKTSYVVAADLSKMELTKILIKKMEGNKSIPRFNEERNLYKALVEAYESDKIILDTYGETVTLKRRRDDDYDKDEEPFAGPDWVQRDAEKERSLSQQALQQKLLPEALAEAVNTACYVLNRVLVTKPQNKTPYELLTGKFYGKSNLGFLVGYSLNSKAFRVYNLETKRVEENLHVNFLENKPNVAGKGHAWMFDLDFLTNSMNHEPVLVENYANKSAGPKKANNSIGTQANDDQSANLEEIYLHEEHFILPIWSDYSSTVKSSGDKIKENTDFKTCVVTDFNNLETTVNVSPTPTTRIHSIHPKTLILREPMSAIQTRSKVNKNYEAHALLSYIQKQQRNNHKDFQHCLFACLLSQIEPKKISQALEDESWVDAMQE
nr:hypothetical protein [Tanacetum cinerariifolium]